MYIRALSMLTRALAAAGAQTKRSGPSRPPEPEWVPKVAKPTFPLCLSYVNAKNNNLWDPTFEADPIGRRLECRPKKRGLFIN